MKDELVENIDFYINDKGLMVFTEVHLLKRGYCCDSGCKHCPYKSKRVKVTNPLYPPKTAS